MTDKIKKIRDEMADKWCGSIDDSSEVFQDGFNAAWTLHEELVAPLLEALSYYGFGEPEDLANETMVKYKEEVGDET